MRSALSLVLAMVFTCLHAQEPLDYYLPEGTQYNSGIPLPSEILGYHTGEFHITNGELVRYMEKLAESSSRVSMKITGYTHEKQPLLLMAFTSPSNQARLEELRVKHINSIDPTLKSKTDEDPLVVWMGYSIHGNEASGVNAAPLMAYYLAAAEGPEMEEMLENTVVLMEPCINPDGVNRFASWVNSHRSMNNVSDPNSLEFDEPWPGGRSNHYWFDLNRDWMFLQHPESRARIAAFHLWKPHLLTDHHEMGGSSTFFFQPGVPSRANPVVPDNNISLTEKLGEYYAAGLDEIGSLYFSEEVFDDFYFGKGSAYPDVNGGIGILFEQASVRGHLSETPYGLMPFSFAIRNQVKSSLSSLKGAYEMREEFKDYQKDFFKSALDEADQSPVKGYVFGCPNDPHRAKMMIDLLSQHKVKVYKLEGDFSKPGFYLQKGEAYFIPCKQPQYRMVRALMEKVTAFADSTFYDISAWTLPLAMGVKYTELDEKTLGRIKHGSETLATDFQEGELHGGIPGTGYLFRIDPYQAPAAIYKLLDKGLVMKISNEAFNIYFEDKILDFPAGTVFVPVQPQKMEQEQLHGLMNELARLKGLEIFSVNTSHTPEGPDLGSGSLSFLEKPEILMLAGGSSRSSYVGQAWFLLDERFNIPVTIAESDRFSSIDLSAYNTLILSASPGRSSDDKLKEWIRGGGRVIALGSGNSYLRSAGIIDYREKEADKAKKEEDKPEIRPYAERRSDYIGTSIPGTIFEAVLDLTNPIAYGYTTDRISIIKRGTDFIAPSENPFSNPVYFTEDPLQSGFINEENLELLKGSVSVMTHSYGRGSVVSFFDDPAFRAYFAGLHKLFMNAIVLGGAM